MVHQASTFHPAPSHTLLALRTSSSPRCSSEQRGEAGGRGAEEGRGKEGGAVLLHSRDPFMPPPCRMLMLRMLSQCPAWRVGAKMESEERGARSEDWGAGSGKEMHRRYIHGEARNVVDAEEGARRRS